MNLKPIEAKHDLFAERVRELLSYAIYNPTEERLDRVLNTMYADFASKMFVLQVEDEICGIIGLGRIAHRTAEILHIAVDQQNRGKDYGRWMVKQVVQYEGLQVLTAETDRDAVGFYSKCGFTIESLGEKYPGVERFRCRLEN